MKRETNPLFQLACYNWLVDNILSFSNSTFRILFLIMRQTIGYQKTSDFLRYSLIAKKTGLVYGTISVSINWLVNSGYIDRLDCNKQRLTSIPKGYRDEIYYLISDNLYQKLEQYYVKTWKSTNAKSDIYKEKYTQREINTNIYSKILTIWNTKNIINQKGITNSIKRVIEERLNEGYTEEDLLKAINNYGEIINGSGYYYDQRYSLRDFLLNKLESFLDLEIAKSNYSEKFIESSRSSLFKVEKGKYDDIIQR